MDIGTPHDFRPQACRWGWNGLSFSRNSEEKVIKIGSTAQMIGIGVGINPSEFILLSFGEQETVWRVEIIRYDDNPTDRFEASLSFIGVPDYLEE